VLACFAFAVPQLQRSDWLVILLALFVFAVALLMISRLRYRSFKELDLADRRSYIYVLPIAACLVAVAYHPTGALLLFSIAYLLSAPAVYLWSLVFKAFSPRTQMPGPESSEHEVADEPALRYVRGPRTRGRRGSAHRGGRSRA
jgi:phosphatidylserine synthase